MNANCRCTIPFKMTIITLMIIWIFIHPTPASASEYNIDVGYTWTEPLDGSPVVHYVVQHSINGGNFVPVTEVADNSCRVIVEMDGYHQLRVAGIDDQGQQGQWCFRASDTPSEFMVCRTRLNF